MASRGSLPNSLQPRRIAQKNLVSCSTATFGCIMQGPLAWEEHTHLDHLSNRLTAKSLKEKQDAELDAARDRECIERGEIVECQCCFTDTPLRKSTTCLGGHPFCLECMRNNTNAQVELSRYQVLCMDGSGCKEGFSREEKQRFLDAKMLELLERLQQQADLRAAEVEGLESCPFCDYAAIYPSIEEDKEFRCLMPACEIVSCRLCRQVSHIPKTCEEYKKEQGVEERHVLEEAMTKALLKTCPKCGVSIVKEGGCNKMICSKCRTAVCDYCGRDITRTGYSHFDNSVPMPDGTLRKGNRCPPHDDTDSRNKRRIEAAEKETIAQIRADNPGISEEDLKIKFSEAVQHPATVGRPAQHGHRPNYLVAGVPPQGFRGHVDPNGFPAQPFGQDRPAPALTEQLLQQHDQIFRNMNAQQNFLAQQHAPYMRRNAFAPPGLAAGPFANNPFVQENPPVMQPHIPRFPPGRQDPAGLRMRPFVPGLNPPAYNPVPAQSTPALGSRNQQPAIDTPERPARRNVDVNSLYGETVATIRQYRLPAARQYRFPISTTPRTDTAHAPNLAINDQINPTNGNLAMELRPPLLPRGAKGVGATVPGTNDGAPMNHYPPFPPFAAGWDHFEPGFSHLIDPSLLTNDRDPPLPRRRQVDVIDLEADDQHRPNSKDKGRVRTTYMDDRVEPRWLGTDFNKRESPQRWVVDPRASRVGSETFATGELPKMERQARPRATGLRFLDDYGGLPSSPREHGPRSAEFALADAWPFDMEG